MLDLLVLRVGYGIIDVWQYAIISSFYKALEDADPEAMFLTLTRVLKKQSTQHFPYWDASQEVCLKGICWFLIRAYENSGGDNTLYDVYDQDQPKAYQRHVHQPETVKNFRLLEKMFGVSATELIEAMKSAEKTKEKCIYVTDKVMVSQFFDSDTEFFGHIVLLKPDGEDGPPEWTRATCRPVTPKQLFMDEWAINFEVRRNGSDNSFTLNYSTRDYDGGIPQKMRTNQFTLRVLKDETVQLHHSGNKLQKPKQALTQWAKIGEKKSSERGYHSSKTYSWFVNWVLSALITGRVDETYCTMDEALKELAKFALKTYGDGVSEKEMDNFMKIPLRLGEEFMKW